MIYITLFLSFIQIGIFSFGGGYAALPLIQNELLNVHNWMSITEFNDMVTISQMTPGPFAINAATFVGVQKGGIFGAVISTYAIVIPSFIICSVLAYFYYKYRNLLFMKKVLQVLRGSVVGLIAVGGFKILDGAIYINYVLDIYSLFLLFAAVFMILKYKVNAILLMIIIGLVYCIRLFL